MATLPSPSANCIKDFYNKICRHFRFISIKRKDTKEEQKKAEACEPHRDLRVPNADESLLILGQELKFS